MPPIAPNMLIGRNVYIQKYISNRPHLNDHVKNMIESTHHSHEWERGVIEPYFLKQYPTWKNRIAMRVCGIVNGMVCLK